MPWLSINRLDLNPPTIKQCCYSGRLSDIRGNVPACGVGGWRQQASPLRGSPDVGCHTKPLFLTQSIDPLRFVDLSLIRIRDALRCGTNPCEALEPGGGMCPAVWGTRLCCHRRDAGGRMGKAAYPRQIKVCLVFATGCSCLKMLLHNVRFPFVCDLTLTTL